MLDAYVAIVVQIVAFVVWIVRIENKVNNLKESHDECRGYRERNEMATVAKLDAINKNIVELTTNIKWIVASMKGVPHVDQDS